MKFIAFEKMSKKKQKEINKQKRNDWGITNPITKIIPNKKKEASKRACRGG